MSKWLSLDIASYASFYRNLVTNEPGAPFFTTGPAPLLISPVYFDNKAHAFSYGVEIFANWNVTPRWRVSPGYGGIHLELTPDSDSCDTGVAQTPGNTPGNQFQLRSFVNLTRRLDWDTSLFHVEALHDAQSTPSYTRLDTRLGWRIGSGLSLALPAKTYSNSRMLNFMIKTG